MARTGTHAHELRASIQKDARHERLVRVGQHGEAPVPPELGGLRVVGQAWPSISNCLCVLLFVSVHVFTCIRPGMMTLQKSS